MDWSKCSVRAPWFRSLFTLHPHPELMATTPVNFQIRNLLVLTLPALWPYIVYRSRSPADPAAHRHARSVHLEAHASGEARVNQAGPRCGIAVAIGVCGGQALPDATAARPAWSATS